MASSKDHPHYCACFPFPIVGTDNNGSISSPSVSAPLILSTTTSLSTTTTPKLQGKIHKSAVNGHLSIASILSNAFLLPSFPRNAYAISQAGKLGLTFTQIDATSKRLALMVSSLAVLPGSDFQVSANNDGDSVILLILDDEDSANEQLICLIFAILRLGATYMVIPRSEVTTDIKVWQQLVSLIDPILVITMSDPIDLPTSMKNDLHLIGREQFDDYHDDMDDAGSNQGSDDDGSRTELNPFQASTTLVKKIRSSLILKPSTYLKAPTLSMKLLWDLAMELNIPNEKDTQLLHFRSDTPIGQRTAFIFECISTSPYPSSIAQWCRLSHKQIRNRISWERIEFPIKPNEKLCLTFPLSDPRSLIQIFNCFIHGKALVLGEPGEFQSAPFLLRKFGLDAFKNVQRIELTPERLEDLLESAQQPKLEFQLAKIKIWIIGSSSTSPFTHRLAKRFFQAVNKFNDVMLVVTYGTPESLWCCTWDVFSSMKEVTKCTHLEKGWDSILYAGVPTTNSTVVIADDWKSSVNPVGQKGEICILGSMVPLGGYCGTTILARPVSLFPTGDFGKFIHDKGGDLQLIVEPRDEIEVTRRKVILQGKLVDLDELSRQIKQNSQFIREAFAFTCQRGRDNPETVVAVVMKDPAKFDTVQEMISTQLTGTASTLVLTSFPIHGLTLPKTGDLKDGPVDLKRLRAAYFKHLGRCTPRDWLTLIPAKIPGRAKNTGEEAIERTIQIICKAVAFSLGCGLTEVIENFEKSFWEMGGSPIRAILTVKSCLCQGKKLAIEDFMIADRISELGFRLVFAEKNETKWFHEIELTRQFFIYSQLTRSDHLEIQDILVANFSKIFTFSEQRTMDQYAIALIEAFDNSLSAVALSAENREMLGISLNYRGNLKTHFVPGKLEEGLELYNAMLQSCRHITSDIENKNIAKSYMISLKTTALVHPSQTLLVIRDLIRESMAYAEAAGCKGFMICTKDPLVQETCCSLLGFDVLTEIQLNLFRNKKFQKPFAHLDDHQVIGVYFAKMSV